MSTGGHAEAGPTAIIVSLSSDIGTAMGERWLARGWSVAGTWRTRSAAIAGLEEQGARTVHCDVADPGSIDAAAENLAGLCGAWDVLVLAPGTVEPIGPFAATGFDAWRASIEVNFLGPMRLVHRLLPSRRLGPGGKPRVLFFAGGGTNGAPVNASAYTVSKIALIKMCELLDAETADAAFTIVGPGWVRTKIHEATFRWGAAGGPNYDRALEKFTTGDFTSMDDVLDCCDWAIASPREVVGGRNVSVVFDAWGTAELSETLRSDPDMYKLRRSGNDRLVRRRGEP